MINYVIGAAVLILVVFRQLQKRSVKSDQNYLIFLVLGVVGLVQFGTFVQQHQSGMADISVVIAGLLIGAGFGALRAYTVRIWSENGQLWRQGNWLTIVLWLVSIGVHIAVEMLFGNDVRGLSAASVVLFVAVSFGVQRLVVGARTVKYDSARPLATLR